MPKPKVDVTQLASVATLFIGMLVIGIMALLLIRIQRGLLGMVLAIITVGLLVYWLVEFKKAFRKELGAAPTPRKSLTCEVLDGKDEVTVVAEVPGPAEKVRVDLSDNTLKITGGQRYKKRVDITHRVEISNVSYLNGILHIRMRKLQSWKPHSSREGEV